jgi:hypothetical protein
MRLNEATFTCVFRFCGPRGAFLSKVDAFAFPAPGSTVKGTAEFTAYSQGHALTVVGK